MTEASPSFPSQIEEMRRFPHFRAHPVPTRCVRMEDDFWRPRQRVTHDVSVDWVTAAHDAAGGLPRLREDPDGYTAQTRAGEMEHVKFIEAMADVIAISPDPGVARLIDAWAQPLIEGQAPDGYLAEGFPLGANHPPQRWRMPAGTFSHEDYVVGHYIEAAIAHREATGGEELFESAVRAADNMADSLLAGEQTYVPGHPEIEQALMRLYAVTGERRYVELCGWILGQRGRYEGRTSLGRYAQDHLPVADQRSVEGHAVCAAYLFNGATQYVGATGDAEYREAVLAVWDDLVDEKLFLHGGSGNLSARNEGYRQDGGSLGPDDCYGESCGTIAHFNWAHSLFALTGEARYLDIAEQVLYNAFAATLSLAGDSSFYTNALQTGMPSYAFGALLLSGFEPRREVRFPEFATSCCPPNIVKLLNRVGGSFYALDEAGLFVKHYGASTAEVPFGPGVTLSQRTRYPWDGEVTLLVEPAAPVSFSLRLRVPAWAKGCRVAVNDADLEIEPGEGWLEIERLWQPGDRVDLSLAMGVERLTKPDSSGYENRAALKRGPIVYCLEEQDLELDPAFGFAGMIPHPGMPTPISTVYIPEGEEFRAEHHPGLLGGITVLTGEVGQVDLDFEVADRKLGATFVPYGVWGNREPSPMRVWLGAHSAPAEEFLSQQQIWCEVHGES